MNLSRGGFTVVELRLSTLDYKTTVDELKTQIKVELEFEAVSICERLLEASCNSRMAWLVQYIRSDAKAHNKLCDKLNLPQFKVVLCPEHMKAAKTLHDLSNKAARCKRSRLNTVLFDARFA